ncbi:hypothetical protein V501_09830 [Pseudogymnoascus sp. VKM F-4519 (FW-2642)]|nr:hypothetical protein V501_09830 [Pseudogymnoascus sp. VKM F-4519 (FW-2642)]
MSELDQQCPNVEEHGQGRHQLNRHTFMRHIRELLRDQLDYCEEMNIHGARGALFKVELPGFGYTIAAKGTWIECVEDLMHESTIYHRLRPLQGKCVSVHLGDTKVDSILYYAGACDPAARNILVNPDRPGITWIDFERAEFVRPRAVPGSLSPNRKRKVSWPHKEGKPHRKDSKENTFIRDTSSYDGASQIGSEAESSHYRCRPHRTRGPHSTRNAYDERKKSDSRMNLLRKLSPMNLVTDIPYEIVPPQLTSAVEVATSSQTSTHV